MVPLVGSFTGPYRRTLHGLTAVAVVVEDIVSEGDIENWRELNAAFRHDMRLLAEKKLEGSPVRVVSLEAATDLPGKPILYLHWTLRRLRFVDPDDSENGYFLSGIAEMVQEARLERKANVMLPFPTWSSGAWKTEKVSEWRATLLDIAVRILDDFVAAVSTPE